MPIISAIPTGSFAPDSASRIVPEPAADLAAAEHGEHHGGVGRSERGADDPGGHPFEAEPPVRDAGDGAAVANVPGTPSDDDRTLPRRGTGAGRCHAAVEEDHDERDDADPRHVLDRDRVFDSRRDVRGDGGGDEKERRRRHGHACGHLRGEHGGHERDSGDDDNRAEVGELGHEDACGHARRQHDRTRGGGVLRERDLGVDARAAAGRALDDERAAERGDPVGEATQAAAVGAPGQEVAGSADAVVDHVDDARSRSRRTWISASVASAYFATFVSASATT